MLQNLNIVNVNDVDTIQDFPKVKIEKLYSPGYHGLLTLGGPEYENITITNNYFDGTGITRYWETNALKHVGSRHVYISNF